MIELLDSFRRVRRSLNLLVVKDLKPLELGPQQASMLRRLAEHKSCSQADLARLCSTDPAATGRILDGLIGRGYVLRQEHPSDRRRWVLTLSPEGRQVAAKVDQALEALAQRLAAPLKASERAQMIEYLDRIHGALQAPADAARPHPKELA